MLLDQKYESHLHKKVNVLFNQQTCDRSVLNNIPAGHKLFKQKHQPKEIHWSLAKKFRHDAKANASSTLKFKVYFSLYIRGYSLFHALVLRYAVFKAEKTIEG